MINLKLNALFKNTLLTLVLAAGCVELPDEVIAPVWNVDLSVPVTFKSYTLLEAIEDEQYLVASDDPTKLGLIQYVDQRNLEPLLFDDKLSVDDFGIRSRQSIKNIKINSIDPIEADIYPNEWSSVLVPGTTRQIPNLSSEVAGNFDEISAFESVIFADGRLEIKMKNDLPVEVILRGFKIINNIDQSIVCEVPAYDPVTIPPQDSASRLFSLIDQKITKSLRYETLIEIPGSNAPVFIPYNAGLTMSIGLMDDILIHEVVAIIPQQEPFSSDSLLLIDDSATPTMLQYAEMKTGNFEIQYNNYLDLDIQVIIDINNLYKPDGTPYQKIVDLSGNERSLVITEPNISGWKISNTEPSKYMNFTVTVYSNGSNDPRVINRRDSVSVSMNFYDFSFVEVTGQISPTNIEFAQSNFEINLNEINDMLEFAELNIKDPALLLKLNSTAGFDILFNGVLTASNDIMSDGLVINNVIIPANAEKVVDLRDHGLKEFINNFTGKFPEHFIFNGNSIVNSNYINGTVDIYDSVGVSLDIELPLELGVKGGRIVDTVEIDLGELNPDDFNSVNFGTLNFEFHNEIPVEASFVAAVLDSANNELLKLPPHTIFPHNTQTILIEAPTTDLNGNVINYRVTTESIELEGSEILSFLNNPRLEVVIDFNTPSQNPMAPVKFKTTDKLNFRISAKLSYKVDI